MNVKTIVPPRWNAAGVLRALAMSPAKLMMRQIGIELPSIQSLFIQLMFDETVLATGTAFACASRVGPVLLTNRHNATGRDNITDECLDKKHAAVPNRLRLAYFTDNFTTVQANLALYDEHGAPAWIEHPRLGARADFVALRLPPTPIGARLDPYDLQTQPNVSARVAETVSVVGYPFGLLGAGSTAVWATGFVASEPNIDYDGLPVFLIDCRTRKGQSGSAVVAHRSGSYLAGGTLVVGQGATRFLGIYSGRINAESDLGMVWKAAAISELLATM